MRRVVGVQRPHVPEEAGLEEVPHLVVLAVVGRVAVGERARRLAERDVRVTGAVRAVRARPREAREVGFRRASEVAIVTPRVDPQRQTVGHAHAHEVGELPRAPRALEDLDQVRPLPAVDAGPAVARGQRGRREVARAPGRVVGPEDVAAQPPELLVRVDLVAPRNVPVLLADQLDGEPPRCPADDPEVVAPFGVGGEVAQLDVLREPHADRRHRIAVGVEHATLHAALAGGGGLVAPSGQHEGARGADRDDEGQRERPTRLSCLSCHAPHDLAPAAHAPAQRCLRSSASIDHRSPGAARSGVGPQEAVRKRRGS